ncbi:RNA-binding protein [Alkalinema sp. FACHB-956]|uniref:RNA recognition motif domain-containing protein n=1 Tax=Alkalinema sp. FACHB-956 TaxID=2692768 RepID=UPI001685C25B|nr:RNA-binding protein [Alkalinema sp. FACHB-956]MBD2326247.1 RNA-binding protein [Alkalinema sp. FACHB-956]
MSVRLYVGNLPEDVNRQDLEAVFSEAGVSAKLITDRKTGKCRGFGFVTVKTDEEADQFIEKFNGVSVKDNAIKIEKALPRSKGDDAAEGSAPAAPASNNRRNKGGNNKGGGGNNRRVASTSDSEGFQPDPRWASDLEKLKQLLAAQTTGS